jgi:isopropylmalate/homocitrate/citramalate synthase
MAEMRHLRGQTVTVVEVGPRDGLQNESTPLSTADKVTFIDRLSDAGLPVIEVTAFVSPRWVPQMADAAEVMASMARRPGVRYRALVPNVRGFERAVAAGVDEIAVVAAASETFSRRNVNQSVDESLAEYARVCDQAAAAALPVRGYLSTAFGCPYEGAVNVEDVVRRTRQLLEIGVFEVAVSDTIGVAHPGQVITVLDRLTAEVAIERLALHLHDTLGTALANVVAGLMCGVRTFDASAGGLGGCPYAPGAAGNLATDDLIYMLDGLGVQTGISAARLAQATRFLASRVGHPLASRYVQGQLARA